MKNKVWCRIVLLFAAVSIMVIAASACGSSTGASPPPTTNSDGSVTYHLKAVNSKFDTSQISVPAGVKVTIVFNNADTVQHNFALYQDSSLANAIYRGAYIGKTTTNYTFTAPTQPGTYFFRCDLHPDMNGSFVVT